MANERLSAFETCQLGVETQAGTAVAATVKLQSISIRPKYSIDAKSFTPAGRLFPTVVALGRDFTEAAFEASPTYEELGYILGSLLCTATGGVYTIDPTSPNTADTFTVECGNASQAVEFAHAAITDATFRWVDKQESTVSGNMIGGKMDSTTLTSLDAEDVTPILPGTVTVTCDGVKLTRAFLVELAISGRWKPVWTIDGATNGYAALAEAIPEGKLTIRVAADAAGMGFLTELRDDNTTRLFEISATDGTNTLSIKVGGKVTGVTEFEDQEGVYAVGYEFALVEEATLGSAIEATIGTVAG